MGLSNRAKKSVKIVMNVLFVTTACATIGVVVWAIVKALS